MLKNQETAQPTQKKCNFALCSQCSNNWRKECLVTKPKQQELLAGIEKCSHYLYENKKPDWSSWQRTN